MRGIHIFEKPYYREISPMRGRPMRGPPVLQQAWKMMSKVKHLGKVKTYYMEWMHLVCYT